MNSKVEKELNNQIEKEAYASQIYLSMASWAEVSGLSGTAKFMYTHAEEERFHMLKLIKFVNERGGKAQVPAVSKPPQKFKDLEDIFNQLLAHEISVTKSISDLVGLCLDEKDYTTHNFLQWYVSEQIEEESLARTVLDKVKLIGNDKGGMYLLDKDLENSVIQSGTSNTGAGV